MSADKPRFSISGWYHRDVPQEGSAHSSLQQLQMKAGEDNIQAHDDFEGEGERGGSEEAAGGGGGHGDFEGEGGVREGHRCQG